MRPLGRSCNGCSRWQIAHSAPRSAGGWGNLDMTDGTSRTVSRLRGWVVDRIPGGYVARDAATEAEARQHSPAGPGHSVPRTADRGELTKCAAYTWHDRVAFSPGLTQPAVNLTADYSAGSPGLIPLIA